LLLGDRFQTIRFRNGIETDGETGVVPLEGAAGADQGSDAREDVEPNPQAPPAPSASGENHQGE